MNSYPAAGPVELLEPRLLLAAVSEQIIVDQFGWRADASSKVAIFADPITGQNAAVTYVPGATFQIRRASDNTAVFTGTVTSWKSGETQTQSGDRVWYGDFSSFTTPGTYYVYDPANDRQSYSFKLDNAVYSPVLRQACAPSSISVAGLRSARPTVVTGTILHATWGPTRISRPCSGSMAYHRPPRAMSMAAGTMPAT